MKDNGSEAQKMLQVMDSASKINLNRELAKKALRGEESSYLKEVLTSMASGTSQNISEEAIDMAVTKYLDEVHTFQEPLHGVQYHLAEAYINRKNIGRKYGIPALAVVCMGLLAWGGIKVGGNIAESVKKSNLENTKTGLESLMTSIRSENPPSAIMQSAESLYNEGMSDINSRNVANARTSEQQLRSLKNQAHEFSVLPGQLESLYSTIMSTAKENDAKAMADSLYIAGENYVRSIQIDSLAETVHKMQDLEFLLNQEYKIEIVSKPGVKSGIDRYYTDSSGKRISGYYLIVESVDSKGNILPQTIKSEEDGNKKIVDMWGERVPEEIYNQVKLDKLDNGIVDNKVFGEKDRGYLNPIILFSYNGGALKRTGQILEW